MLPSTVFIRAFVRQMLEDTTREWTVQGFGFIRTYFGDRTLPKRFRLNLWHSAFTVPNVSTIHDHPWDFTSLIVAGETYNQRYTMGPVWRDVEPTHQFTTIKTGIGGGIVKTDPALCILHPKEIEHYKFGDSYYQAADEIHETKFSDGAITINERNGDTERARVFWPYGTEWVDAIPRVATKEEVEFAVNVACGKAGWF